MICFKRTAAFLNSSSQPFRRNALTFVALAGLIGLIGAFWPMPVQSQPEVPAESLLDGITLKNPDPVLAFYDTHQSGPIWVRGPGDFQPRVTAVLEILDQSWSNGLNPQDYKTDKIRALLAGNRSEARRQAEMLITDSVLRYMQDMTGLRGGFYPYEKQIKYWRAPMDVQTILADLSNATDPVSYVRAVEPKGRLYQSLRREFVSLARLPDDSNFKPIKLPSKLSPGKMSPKVPELRARLGLEPAIENETTYDEAMAVAVMKLQKSYDLDTDGIIGGRTLEIINMKREDKIAQIVANMERLRWIDDGRPDRYILVNVPSATLWAVDAGSVALEMPVIIGKTGRPTHSFKTDITGVRFNPNWTVPPTIKREDFLPALQQDPEILTKRGIRVTYKGETINPAEVDWTKVSPSAMANLRMIQNPGDDNPLGKVRVIMENPFNIYLHDTNHREMFDKNDRALSSGCIRVSKPEELANFILMHNEGWTREGMDKMIASGRMRDIKTDAPLPVYIMYQTVWLDDQGRLIYGRDVYGQDAHLYSILMKKKAIHMPTASEITEISL
jgi:murein L,D-transpeptidase YcbB/YkuD